MDASKDDESSGRRRLPAVVVLLLFATIAGAQEQGESISFQEYEAQIRENLPEIRIHASEAQRKQNDVLAAEGRFDPVLTAGVGAFREEPFGGNPYYSVDTTRGIQSSVGVEKTIAPSGTRVSLSTSYRRAEQEATTSAFVPSPPPGGFQEIDSSEADAYQPSLSISLTQPLLQNAFGALDRFPLERSRLGAEEARWTRDSQDDAVLNGYRKLYYQWAETEGIVASLQQAVENAESLLQRSQGQFDDGLVENDDLQESRILVFRLRSRLEEAEAERQRILNAVGRYVEVQNRSPDAEEVEQVLEEVSGFDGEVPDFGGTRTARIITLAEEQASLARDAADRRLYPQVALSGTFTFSGASQDSFGDSLGELDATDGRVELSLRHPLGASTARSSLEDAELSLRQAGLTYRSRRDRYQERTASLASSIGSMQRRLNLQEQIVDATESQLDTEEEKYQQARIPLADLVETRNLLAEERITLYRLRIEVIGAYLDWQLITRTQ